MGLGSRDRATGVAPPATRKTRRPRVTSPARAGARSASEWHLALCLLAGAGFLRLALGALIPLFPDETYYWEWSRHLATGYYDHPPGIAVVIRAGTWLASHTGLALSPGAVRLVVIPIGFFATVVGTAIARRIGGDRAALIAAVAFCAMPLSAAGLILATPDAPLLLATAATLYCVVRALEAAPGSTSAHTWWLCAGIALGGAFASKYTSILVPIGVTLAMVSRTSLRHRLREPGPYAAGVAATLVFLPVLAWNEHHAWASFAFQFQHGLGASGGSAVNRELSLLGGQAGLATPILFVLLAIAVWRALRAPASDLEYLLAVVTLTFAGTFALSALRRPVEANWPAVAYIAGVPLLASSTWGSKERRWLNWGLGLAATVSVVIYVQSVVPVLPLSAPRDPIARSAGWEQLAESVSVARIRLGGDRVGVWIGADRYQDASELAFHSLDQPRTFSMNLAGRPNQYDFWDGFPAVAKRGDDLVLALDEGLKPHPAAALLGPHFQALEQGSLVTLLRRDGSPITRRRLWILRGWDGTWVAASDR
jgi:4-amino-4-deoxy-L-arabinose transferase-like glycosyltransferase